MAAITAPSRVGAQHKSLIHFVGSSPWDDGDVLGAVRDYALPPLLKKSSETALLVDDTGMVKKGTHSVGVARQYCGEVGKQENCQVAVSLTIANDFGSLPIAYRLYLPERWANDPVLRKKAKIPNEIVFLTKLEIALAQIEDAVKAGVPRGPVLGDAGYGNDSKFRARITELGLSYCVGVHSTTTVWPLGAGPLPPAPRGTNGRPPTRLRRAPGHEPVAVKALAQSLPESALHTVQWREGAKGKMKSRFCAMRVRPANRDDRRTKPHDEEWLIIEWPKSESEPTKYWLSTLPATMSLKELVRLAKLRWRIERDYEELKDEVGLNHYEGRGWRGFHHHATLCIAAYAFLMTERLFSPSGETAAERGLPVPSVPASYRPRGSADSA
jgi:SRSO17 transposase